MHIHGYQMHALNLFSSTFIVHLREISLDLALFFSICKRYASAGGIVTNQILAAAALAVTAEQKQKKMISTFVSKQMWELVNRSEVPEHMFRRLIFRPFHSIKLAFRAFGACFQHFSPKNGASTPQISCSKASNSPGWSFSISMSRTTSARALNRRYEQNRTIADRQ